MVQIAFSSSSACARYADGSVRCWGSGSEGALGLDPPPIDGYVGNDPAQAPQLASLGGPIVDLPSSPGPFHCGLRSDGEIVCWGDGQGPSWWDDELGDQWYSGVLGPRQPHAWFELEESFLMVGDLPGEMPPPIPLGGAGSTLLSLGSHSACAIATDGALRCWGQAHDSGWPSLG